MRRFLPLCCAIFFVGCSNETPPVKEAVQSPKADTASATRPSITLSQDPAAHFKPFINRFSDLVKSQGKNKEADDIRILLGEVESLTYDVQKTDSLVSPFVATAIIAFAKVVEDGERPHSSRHVCKFTFPAQDGKWTYRDPVCEYYLGPVRGKLTPSEIFDFTKDAYNERFQKLWHIASAPDSEQ